MNELLGIKKDEDIIAKESATEEEVYRHRDERVGDPALNPMHPYFLKGGFNTWNDCLCEKFADYYEEKIGIPFTDIQKADVEVHFMEHITCLGRAWRKARTKSQDERIIAERKALERARANSRRSMVSVLPCALKVFDLNGFLQLYDDRREIALGNMFNQDGTVHEGWKALFDMVERIGMVGMSSDESEVEGKRTVYIIKRRAWRSEEVQRRLIFIDNDRNTTGSTGGARPGNPPCERCRLTSRQTISKRDPSLGCLINYYDRIYHAGLDNRQVNALNLKPEEIFQEL